MCEIRSQNSRMIVCSIQNDGTAGGNDVSVYIAGKGKAALRNATTSVIAFVNPLSISDIVPDTVSPFGSGLVTVLGEYSTKVLDSNSTSSCGE